MIPDRLDLFALAPSVVVATAPVGLPVYDFDFRAWLPCRTLPYGTDAPVIARFGAIDAYDQAYALLAERGLRLVNDPAQHERAANILGWEPRLRGLTPETLVFDRLPSAEVVGDRLGWPLFIKGERQTSRHRRALSIARDPSEYAEIVRQWDADRILRWQKAAVRTFVPLRHIGDRGEGLPASFEFRVFCWYGVVVGVGPYWVDHRYALSPAERDVITELATRVAARVDVPFLVVDIAQTAEGAWIVIECNDAQECGYAGVLPLVLWQRIVEGSS